MLPRTFSYMIHSIDVKLSTVTMKLVGIGLRSARYYTETPFLSRDFCLLSLTSCSSGGIFHRKESWENRHECIERMRTAQAFDLSPFAIHS